MIVKSEQLTEQQVLVLLRTHLRWGVTIDDHTLRIDLSNNQKLSIYASIDFEKATPTLEYQLESLD